MIYWFAVAPDRPEILDVGIRNGLWGVVEDARDEIDVLEPGDYVLFFHRDDGFVLCEVESEPYTERVPVWSEVDFPHRVRISEPVETDRYAHLGEVHDCLLDPETGEPYSSTAGAASALEAAAGTFRPLTDDEIRCLFGRLGWTPPPGVVAAPPEDEAEVEPEPAEEAEPGVEEETEPDEEVEPAGGEEEEEPDAEERTPAVAAPVDEGPEPAGAGSAPAEEPSDEEEAGPEEPAGAAAAETEAAQEAEAEPGPPEGDAEEAEPAGAEAPPEEPEPDEEAPAGPRVILAPAAGNAASRRRWNETVEEGVPIDRVEDHLSEGELERLRRSSDAGRVRVWGTAPARDEGSRAQWSDSGPGDVILFSGGGEIFASARVLAKRRDPELAEELWGRRDDGDTWEFLFFATEPVSQSVPYEELNDVAGYEPGYRIPRLNILETERSIRILGAFPEFAVVSRERGDEGDEGDRPEPSDVEEAPTEATAGEPATEEADDAVEPVGAGTEPTADGDEPVGEIEEEPADEPEPSDVEGTPATDDAGPDVEEAPARGGVGAMDEVRLRTLLFGRRELGRCALCGRLLPVELLSVVYVKPLEACAPDELEDVGNNVLPGCRLGCAGLFREGFVVVEDGVVQPGREEPLTDPVEERIEELVGNRCEYWHSGSEAYFHWHASEHRER